MGEILFASIAVSPIKEKEKEREKEGKKAALARTETVVPRRNKGLGQNVSQTDAVAEATKVSKGTKKKWQQPAPNQRTPSAASPPTERQKDQKKQKKDSVDKASGSQTEKSAKEQAEKAAKEQTERLSKEQAEKASKEQAEKASKGKTAGSAKGQTERVHQESALLLKYPTSKQGVPRKSVLPETSSFQSDSLLATKLTMMRALQLQSPPKGGSSAAGASTAVAPNTHTTLALLHESTAAAQISSRITSEDDGYIAKRTDSGTSYGSAAIYAEDWNAVDLCEVTSNPYTGKPHPAGPSALAHRVYEAQVAIGQAQRAVVHVDQTAKVMTQPLFMQNTYLPSPRHSGWIRHIQVESLKCDLLILAVSAQDGTAAQTKVYKKLLGDHKRLSDKHKLALAELKLAKGEHSTWLFGLC